MSKTTLLATVAAMGLGLVACNSRPELAPVPDDVAERRVTGIELTKAAGGEWDNLDEEGKQFFIDEARGFEDQARANFNYYASDLRGSGEL